MRSLRRGAVVSAIFVLASLFCAALFYGLQWQQRAKNAAPGNTPFSAPLEIAPDVDVEDKIIVVGKLSTDETDWVGKELSEWKNAIYTVNDTSAHLHTPANKGHEAMAYLTYLIDNYYSLPATLVFVHSHRDGWGRGWHTDNNEYSNVESISNLNKTFVHEQGYVNLRCNGNPGCPDEIRLDREEPSPTELAMRAVWPLFFPGREQPDIIATPCCAQFAVSRAAVHTRYREDYIKYRQFLIDTELEDDVSGRLLEYLWHIIFGKPPRYCPDAKYCYLVTYGWRMVITGPGPRPGYRR